MNERSRSGVLRATEPPQVQEERLRTQRTRIVEPPVFPPRLRLPLLAPRFKYALVISLMPLYKQERLIEIEEEILPGADHAHLGAPLEDSVVLHKVSPVNYTTCDMLMDCFQSPARQKSITELLVGLLVPDIPVDFKPTSYARRARPRPLIGGDAALSRHSPLRMFLISPSTLTLMPRH